MTRYFYLVGIFFIGLCLIAALFQSLIFFRIGYQLYSLQSFANWFIVITITSLICSLFILIYVYKHQYYFALSAGILTTLTSFCQNLLFYLLVCLMVSELQPFYIPALMSSLLASLIYGITLVFSKAGKKRWLMNAGVYTLIIVITSAIALIWSQNNPVVQTNGQLERVSQWLSLAGSLVLVPYVILFYSEFKTTVNAASTQKQKYIDASFAFWGLAAIVILVFGIKIVKQTYQRIQISPATKAMMEQFETRAYESSEQETMEYLLLKPLNYDTAKEYPLVVDLPYGKYEGALIAQLLTNDANRMKYPAFLLVPYCRPGEGWGGIPNYPTVDTLVFETILVLEKEFAIDKKRIYVTGISRGGYGAWHFISTRPEMFAAAIPVCGGGKPQLAPHIAGVSVWAFHGAKDRNVPVSGSQDMIEAIKLAGGEPRYTEFPDKGHNIWEAVKDTPDLLDWLFAQEKD